MKGKKQGQKQDGITLIALVITIIVLIILAMVTIAMLTGPNGLINKSLEAKIASDKAEIKDRAETEVLASMGKNGKINWGELKENLIDNFKMDEDSIKNKEEGDESKGLIFTVEKNNRNYDVKIDEKGKVKIKYEGEETIIPTTEPSEEPTTELSEEPSIEQSKEPTQMLNPGETASKTQKDNYEDTNNKKATIPKDFTISSEDYEIDTGLVVTAKDGSEFVWVPVEKVIAESEADGNDNKAMAVIDPADGNNYRGILYDFPNDTTESKVISGCTTTNFTNTNSQTSYREPAYLTDGTSGDANKSANNGRVTEDGLKSEYKAMIESVADYGGFYVGRYETSLSEGKAQSKKGQTPMDATTGSGNTWWGMYEKEKNYANINGISDIVGSSMIWGSQYDAMLNWILKGNDAEKVAKSSTKHSKTSTGNTENDKMNKIYDLGNNLYEWTLEASNTNSRIIRGSYYGSTNPPSNRFNNNPTNPYGSDGSRLALYIY